jgi:hypothetical protein
MQNQNLVSYATYASEIQTMRVIAKRYDIKNMVAYCDYLLRPKQIKRYANNFCRMTKTAAGIKDPDAKFGDELFVAPGYEEYMAEQRRRRQKAQEATSDEATIEIPEPETDEGDLESGTPERKINQPPTKSELFGGGFMPLEEYEDSRIGTSPKAILDEIFSKDIPNEEKTNLILRFWTAWATMFYDQHATEVLAQIMGKGLSGESFEERDTRKSIGVYGNPLNLATWLESTPYRKISEVALKGGVDNTDLINVAIQNIYSIQDPNNPTNVESDLWEAVYDKAKTRFVNLNRDKQATMWIGDIIDSLHFVYTGEGRAMDDFRTYDTEGNVHTPHRKRYHEKLVNRHLKNIDTPEIATPEQMEQERLARGSAEATARFQEVLRHFIQTIMAQSVMYYAAPYDVSIRETSPRQLAKKIGDSQYQVQPWVEKNKVAVYVNGQVANKNSYFANPDAGTITFKEDLPNKAEVSFAENIIFDPKYHATPDGKPMFGERWVESIHNKPAGQGVRRPGVMRQMPSNYMMEQDERRQMQEGYGGLDVTTNQPSGGMFGEGMEDAGFSANPNAASPELNADAKIATRELAGKFGYELETFMNKKIYEPKDEATGKIDEVGHFPLNGAELTGLYSLLFMSTKTAEEGKFGKGRTRKAEESPLFVRLDANTLQTVFKHKVQQSEMIVDRATGETYVPALVFQDSTTINKAGTRALEAFLDRDADQSIMYSMKNVRQRYQQELRELLDMGINDAQKNNIVRLLAQEIKTELQNVYIKMQSQNLSKILADAAQNIYPQGYVATFIIPKYEFERAEQQAEAKVQDLIAKKPTRYSTPEKQEELKKRIQEEQRAIVVSKYSQMIAKPGEHDVPSPRMKNEIKPLPMVEMAKFAEDPKLWQEIISGASEKLKDIVGSAIQLDQQKLDFIILKMVEPILDSSTSQADDYYQGIREIK